MSVKDQLKNTLEKGLPYSYNVKTLYRILKGKVSENTIKVTLSRMVRLFVQ